MQVLPLRILRILRIVLSAVVVIRHIVREIPHRLVVLISAAGRMIRKRSLRLPGHPVWRFAHLTVNRAHRDIIAQLLRGRHAVSSVILKLKSVRAPLDSDHFIRIIVSRSAVPQLRILLNLFERHASAKLLLYFGQPGCEIHIIVFCVSVMIPEMFPRTVHSLNGRCRYRLIVR